MNDTEILDWIERHVLTIQVSSHVKITWTKGGGDHHSTGDDLREAVRLANWDDVAKEVKRSKGSKTYVSE